MCRTVWMWLLILAVLPLFCESEDERKQHLKCCISSSNAEIHHIKECFEQKPRKDCNFHAFLVVTQDDKQYCVTPNTPWLKRRMNEGLKCPPEFSPKPRFEVLNKVDME